MRIIQNLACIEVVVNPDDNKIIIKKDILKDKKINSMFVFGSTEDNATFSPFSNEFITQKDEIQHLNLFMNLTDKDKNIFIKDFCIDAFDLNTESLRQFNYDIERVIDEENIVLSSKSFENNTNRLLLYVIYQNDNIKPSTDDINGSISFAYTPASQIEDVKLKDIAGYLLNDKPIKSILCNMNSNAGYLDLRSKNGKRIIENIPLQALTLNAPSCFEIDPLFIDCENSYLRIRAFTYYEQIQLTFIY